MAENVDKEVVRLRNENAMLLTRLNLSVERDLSRRRTGGGECLYPNHVDLWINENASLNAKLWTNEANLAEQKKRADDLQASLNHANWEIEQLKLKLAKIRDEAQ